ncbi:hypothetical protein [Sphaerisporangium sp. TRM90804]|uniref:hypothetical protein n=1 Tax=Sphaerisporangium sp. TRM90804 TaxID=3031113 RepID=UPI0024477983|nr:hypothetical protein [Sphaerisporangium sp. TRM90804]MDH2426112.1 hypothetical protein [Sphaerisporangium sp. TRM90804]
MVSPGGPGLTLLAHTAAPGTPSADSPRLLSPWAATRDDTRQQDHDRSTSV